MADLLRVLFDAVGVRATYGAELEADHGSAWTHRFSAGPDHVWVTTRHTALWVGRGDATKVLPPGKGAVLAPGADRWVGTSLEPRPEPRADLGPVGGISLAAGGTHHGALRVGHLFDGAVRLPSLFSTASNQDLYRSVDADVLLALEHLGPVAGARWPGPAQDALAQLLVVSMLTAWRIPVLDDRGLTRCFDALADQAGCELPALADATRMSRSTIARRFRDTTGLTPDEFRRWLHTLAVRTALHAGSDPSVVAQRFGFASVRAMVRTVERVERTTIRLPTAGRRSPLPD